MNSNVLADRDTNQTMQDQSMPNPFAKKETGDKPKSMDFHRQMMENKLKEGQGLVGESQEAHEYSD